jgi:predicted site-specific integrase-resolvase
MFKNFGENVSEVSRRYGIPIPTLHRWVKKGFIRLPEDVELLKGAKRIKGNWYLAEAKKKGGQ